MKYNPDLDKSKSVHWSTPKELYSMVMAQGFFDPCPLNCNTNNLNDSFYDCALFINPPFDDLDTWVDFAIRQYFNNCDVTLLMPARTDTKYFNKLLNVSPVIYFIIGRLAFGEGNKKAPFPTIIVELWHFRKPRYEYGTLDDYIRTRDI